MHCYGLHWPLIDKLRSSQCVNYLTASLRSPVSLIIPTAAKVTGLMVY